MNTLRVTKKVDRLSGNEYFHAEMSGSPVIGTGFTLRDAVRSFLANQGYQKIPGPVPTIVVCGTETLTIKEALK